MTMRSWIRNLFAPRTPRTIRKAAARRPMQLELLEDRVVLDSYTAANTAELISAINQANAVGGTNDITLTAPNWSEYTLDHVDNILHGATGLPVIAAGNNLTIAGDGDRIMRFPLLRSTTDSGSVVDVNFRLFDVAEGATLNLRNVTLQGGVASGRGVEAQGGAIYSAGTLTLDGVTVTGNLAQGKHGVVQATWDQFHGSSAFGGGIFVAAGTVNITNSTLSQNRAVGGNGSVGGNGFGGGTGGDAFGGAIYVATGTVTLMNDTLGGNFAQGGVGGRGTDGSTYWDVRGLKDATPGSDGGDAYGGGVYVAAGTAHLTNDTLSGNFASGGAGGDGGKANRIPIDGGNGGHGGGAEGGGVYVAQHGTATLTNDTLGGNGARSGVGGAGGSRFTDAEFLSFWLNVVAPVDFLYDIDEPRGSDGSSGRDGGSFGGGIGSDGGLAVRYSTIANNTAGWGGGINSRSLSLTGSIVAGNTTNDLAAYSIDSSYSLIGNGDGTGLTNGVNGNLLGTFAVPLDPRLGPLQNNGGPTQTMALLPGSPAIDAGNNGLLPAGAGTDQRGVGFPRIPGNRVDIGAYEVTPRAANEKFVQALYHHELGRTGAAAELDTWVSVVGGTGGRAAAVSGIVNSVEARSRMVAGWFQTYLGRAADAATITAFATALASQTEEQMISGILGSQEFFNRAQTLGFGGTANQNFVRALYQAVLGRTASSVEVDGHVNSLPQFGRQRLALAFLQSPEYRGIVVRGYYTSLLGRAASAAEVAGQVNSGLGVRALRIGIESSPEFFNVSISRAPTITAFTVPSAGREGSPVSLSAMASNPHGNFHPLRYTWAITRPDGSTLTTLTGVSTSFTPPDDGSYGVSLTVSDDVGGTATRSATVGVANVAPTITAFTVPATGFEGSLVNLGASAADPAGVNDPLGYTWTITRPDGSTLTTLTGVSTSFTPPDDGSYGVSLTVSDGDGGTATRSATVGVANAAPTITAFTVPATGFEGSLVNLGASAADPAGVNDPLGYTWTITRPDGSTLTTLTGVSTSFTPPDDGSYGVSLTVSDDVGGTATRSATVGVANAAPTITAFTVPATGFEGSLVNLGASAADPAGVNDPLGYTWTITRPDGSTLATLGGASASFTPPDNGDYAVSLSVSDGDGGTATASRIVSAGLVSLWRADGNAKDMKGTNNGTLVGGVSYAAGKVDQAFNFDGTGRVEVVHTPSLNLTSAVTLEAWIKPTSLSGLGAVLAKGSLTERGYGLFVRPDGGLQLSYFTTGGTKVGLNTAANLVRIGQFSHVAAVIDSTTGSMRIYVDGQLQASGASSGPLVANAAPLTIGRERASSNPSLNVFPFTGLIDEPAVYDRALSQAEIQSRLSLSLAVANAAPTATFSGPSTGLATQVLTFSAAATDPSAVDQAAGFTYTINWGDGSPIQTVARAAGNGGGVSLTHAYAATGTFLVTVTATDKDNGSSAVASHTITVVPVALQTDPVDPSRTALVVVGTAGNDQIAINAGPAGSVAVLLNGVSQGSFSPTGRIIVHGQAGDDNIQVAAGVSLPAWLYGGDGHDTLQGGGAAGVLLGGTGNDRLVGGQGRNLLIGGMGTDSLTGTGSGDLLVAGTAAFDATLVALDAILAEWTSARTYAERVANLRGTGTGPRANGDTFLQVSGPSATVFDDGAADQLQGSSGADWFFANLSGGVLDLASGMSDTEMVEELSVLVP